MIELIGTGLFGASLGLFTGIIIAKKLGLSASAREMKRALDANEAYYKQRINRFKGLIKEYEQPSELQSLAHKNSDDIVGSFISQIGGIKGLPTWLRPFLPAITDWAKSNPDQIQALMHKFLTPQKQNATDSQDYL